MMMMMIADYDDDDYAGCSDGVDPGGDLAQADQPFQWEKHSGENLMMIMMMMVSTVKTMVIMATMMMTMMWFNLSLNGKSIRVRSCHINLLTRLEGG